MVQIVRDIGPGEKLGTGLSAALSALAQSKFNQVQQQHESQRQQAARQSGLQALFGPEQAKALSSLDESLLKPIVQEKARGQRQQLVTGEGIKTIAPLLSDEKANKVATLSPGLQQIWYRNYLENPQQAIQSLDNLKEPIRSEGELSGKEFNEQELKELADLNKGPSEQEVIGPKPETALPVEKKLSPKEEVQHIRNLINKEKPKSLSDYMKQGLSRKEAFEHIKADIKEEKTEQKEGQKYQEDLQKAKTAATENNKRLDRMQTLINKYQTPNPFIYKLIEDMKEAKLHTKIPLLDSFLDYMINLPLSTVGTGLSYLQKSVYAPGTEEFEKLIQDFTRNAKDVFGARVTNMEFDQFLKSIPSLLQTDNGKKAVIRNMRNFNNAALVKAESLEKILKANKGKRPANLALLIDQVAKPELDKLAEEFVKGINRDAKFTNFTEKELGDYVLAQKMSPGLFSK